MPKLFTYNDYRKYLADYYGEKKANNPAFSYQNFSKAAGFSSKSFVFNVIKGRKNLSRSSIVKMAEAVSLNATESAYFENLVYYNQARDHRERKFFFDKLNSMPIRDRQAAKAKQLRKDQFEYYTKWYNTVIRSLIDMYDFRGDYKWLAKRVSPPITPLQAKKSVQLLQRLGLIKKNGRGKYTVTDKVITTGREFQSMAVQQYHIENMKLAENAIRTLPRDKRNISGLTLGISQEGYEKTCRLILECQDRIMEVAEKDEKADSVYQLNFHFFPVSKNGPAKDKS
jgi:uncharacterized protein (TIGR02147 family)